MNQIEHMKDTVNYLCMKYWLKLESAHCSSELDVENNSFS